MPSNMTNFTNTTDWETDTDPTPEEHGEENKMKSYMIVGGEAVSLNDYQQKYQFMCSVLIKQDFNDKTYIVHSCGCTMIAANVALTAAHCAEYADYVKVGKLYRDTSQNENEGLKVETYRVKAIRVHKDFDHDTFSNDVMLLKLNGKTEKPLAKMQFSNIQRNVNDEMTIVGWGFISSGTQIPASTLRDVNVKYISTPTCKEYYGEMINDESMFCAFDKGKDACQGDSGGPIIRETEDGQVVQVGIVSWGYQCAVFPGVYTDLSKEIITNFIHTTVCHARHGISTQSCIKGKLPNII